MTLYTFFPLQNDVSDIPDLTFSMDADEEKHILYEKNQVFECQLLLICEFYYLFSLFLKALCFFYLVV